MKRIGGFGSGFGESLTKLRGVAAQPLPVAIEFGTSSLKVLQVAQQSEQVSLVAAGALPIPEAMWDKPEKRLQFQLEALPNLLKSSGVKAKRAVCSIPISQTICRILKVTRIEGMTVSELTASALGAQIGCPPAALVVRPTVISGGTKGNPKMDVLCLAARRDLVETLMRAMKASKLEPVGIQNEFIAMMDAFAPLSRRSEDHNSNTLYIDMGFGATNVLIAHGRDPVFAKSIDVGGRTFDQTIAKLMKIDDDDAHERRLKMRSVQPADADDHAQASQSSVNDRLASAVGVATRVEAVHGPKLSLIEPMEILTDELALCLRYHDSAFPDKPLSRIVFVGGESRHRMLCEHVARAIRLPAQVADPMAIVNRSGKEPVTGVDMTKPQPGWAVALGLCLGKTDL